jgi:hypothetical protein
MNDPIVSDPHLFRNPKKIIEPALLKESWKGIES